MNARPTAVPYVLLDDNSSPEGAGYLFTDPVDRLVCHDPETVPQTLAAIDAARNRGLYAAGFLAYELGYALEPKLGPLMPVARNTPLIWMGLFEHRRDVDVTALIEEEAGTYRLEELRPELERAAYSADIAAIKDAIASGDVYQINHTFKFRFDFSGDPLALYGELRRKQRAAFGAVVADADFHILSLSPELFVEARDGTARGRPMKGTAPRGPTPEADASRQQWLRNDEKSRAEHLMIVDLVRNDLGRLATTGSVRVPDLFRIETYPTLHQMVSDVTADLRPGVGFGDLARALFPCGSITGAPKIRAMEIIRDLEPEARGVYTGAVGMVAPDGALRFNVAIRTLRLDQAGKGELGVGGGIVFDSDAEAEYGECLLKARFLTDPCEPFQLIETLLLEAGGYALLDHHLERLATSATFFGFPCDSGRVRRDLEALADDLGDGSFKVRLLLDERGKVSLNSAPLTPPASGARLTYTFSGKPVDRDSPFTFHKTTRRRLLDDARERAESDEVLFVNDRGEVTEGSYTNVFIERDGRLLTPPVDCGLLAGTLRRQLLEEGRAVEALLTPADLESADAVYLGNSVRGLVPAIPV